MADCFSPILFLFKSAAVMGMLKGISSGVSMFCNTNSLGIPASHSLAFFLEHCIALNSPWFLRDPLWSLVILAPMTCGGQQGPKGHSSPSPVINVLKATCVGLSAAHRTDQFDHHAQRQLCGGPAVPHPGRKQTESHPVPDDQI